jgi:uncharacterized membrane protein
MKNNIWTTLRKSFFAGLVVVVPLAASIGILLGLFNWVTGFLLPHSLLEHTNAFLYRIIALAVFTFIVTSAGWVTRLVIGRRLVTLTEQAVARVPLLNRVYSFVKDVSNTMFSGKKSAFQRVVLVEFPRAGSYAIGFVTSETEGEAQAQTQGTVVNVFVPTTPNPTSGFLILVPRSQLIEMKMSVADGMKMVISGGSVVPPYTLKNGPPAPTAHAD